MGGKRATAVNAEAIGAVRQGKPQTGAEYLESLRDGREVYVGSRRGVPYHAKIGYGWTGERPPLPRHLGPKWTEELLRPVSSAARVGAQTAVVWKLV